MARVQLIIPDQDRNRYASMAKQAGLSLSAWLRHAANEKIDRESRDSAFKSVEDFRAFYKTCRDNAGEGREPDWEEHLKIINQSRDTGHNGT